MTATEPRNREQFEAWYSDMGDHKSAVARAATPPHEYLLQQARISWMAWQAATAAQSADLRRLRISQLRRMAEIAESHGAHMVREATPHIDLHPYYLKDVQQGEKLLRFAAACRAEIERLRGES